ncbi:MAG: hemolysin III family protein [Betaproteobacteria bacterium]
MIERSQTFGEEIANSVSHGFGLLAALIGIPVLLVVTSNHGAAINIVGASIFAATMLVLYAISTVYHALPEGKAKRVFMKLDHAAIFVFIAGCYTPFALGALHGPWGWTLLGAVWGLAALGVTLKALDRLSNPWLSTGLYLLMGWLVVIAAVPLFTHVPAAGIGWLAAGGLAYTLGCGFFMTDSRIRFGHAVWHLFVLAGTSCHFVAVLAYSM